MMIDREKIIRGLECCRDGCMNDCPYLNEGNCFSVICSEALELIRARQPARLIKILSPSGQWTEDCGACHSPILRYYNYCPFCGVEVKRE